MTAWFLPASPLTEDAFAFRRRWVDRWQGYVPYPPTAGSPQGAVYDHRHAHPEFRDPLSFSEGMSANNEFHAAVIERLAAGQPVTLMTFDWEWEEDDHHGREVSALDGVLERDPLFSMLENPDDDEGAVTHVFISHIGANDARIREIWKQTANGQTPAWKPTTTPSARSRTRPGPVGASRRIGLPCSTWSM